jgi:hypothetical protein
MFNLPGIGKSVLVIRESAKQVGVPPFAMKRWLTILIEPSHVDAFISLRSPWAVETNRDAAGDRNDVDDIARTFTYCRR